MAAPWQAVTVPEEGAGKVHPFLLCQALSYSFSAVPESLPGFLYHKRQVGFRYLKPTCTRKYRARLRLVVVAGLDAGCLAFEFTQVVQTAATHETAGYDIDVVDEGGVEGEDTLNTNAVGNLAHSKGGASGAAVNADDAALENLNTLFFAFNNAQVNLDGVAGTEGRQIRALIFAFDFANDIHYGCAPVHGVITPENFRE